MSTILKSKINFTKLDNILDNIRSEIINRESSVNRVRVVHSKILLAYIIGVITADEYKRLKNKEKAIINIMKYCQYEDIISAINKNSLDDTTLNSLFYNTEFLYIQGRISDNQYDNIEYSLNNYRNKKLKEVQI